MIHPLSIDTVADLDVTSAERAALNRLAGSKDFDTLVEIMGRWLLAQNYDLLRAPTPDQNFELLRNQGALAMLREMVKFVDTSQPLPAPKKK